MHDDVVSVCQIFFSYSDRNCNDRSEPIPHSAAEHGTDGIAFSLDFSPMCVPADVYSGADPQCNDVDVAPDSAALQEASYKLNVLLQMLLW